MSLFPAAAVEHEGDEHQGKWKTCEQVKQHPRATNDSQKELKRQHVFYENGNELYQNLWEPAQLLLRGRGMAINVGIDGKHLRNHTLCLRELEKKTTKSKEQENSHNWD